jgi:hypothetical protein
LPPADLGWIDLKSDAIVRRRATMRPRAGAASGLGVIPAWHASCALRRAMGLLPHAHHIAQTAFAPQEDR